MNTFRNHTGFFRKYFKRGYQEWFMEFFSNWCKDYLKVPSKNLYGFLKNLHQRLLKKCYWGSDWENFLRTFTRNSSRYSFGNYFKNAFRNFRKSCMGCFENTSSHLFRLIDWFIFFISSEIFPRISLQSILEISLEVPLLPKLLTSSVNVLRKLSMKIL